MRKFTHGAKAARLGPAVAAAAVLMTAACDDSVSPFPSRGPAVDMDIFTIPANQPFVVLRDQSLRLLAVPVDANDMWVEAPVTWTSSNEAIAPISSDGVITAVGNVNASQVDTVTVTATSAGQTATQAVIIRRFPAVAAINVSAPSPFLRVGSTVQLTAQAVDIAGNVIAGRELTWTSSNTAVATVTQTGLVTMVAAGSANISASADEDGVIISGTRTVNTPPALPTGATAVPNISDGAFAEYVIIVPAGTSSLVVSISGATSGDADLYVYSPNTVPGAAGTGTAGSGFTCRPFLIGSNETCTINNPAAGAWGVRIHAFGGDGTVAGLNITVTMN